MKKLIIPIILVLFIIVQGVYGEICEGILKPYEECTMMTPTLICQSYNYTIYNTTTQVKEGGLTYVDDSIYKFVFNESEGDYIVRLCDNSTREIKVYSEDNNMIFVGIILVFIFLSALSTIGFIYSKSLHIKVIVGNVMGLLIVSMMRFTAWFTEITYPSQTGLIESLNVFYSFSVIAFTYFIVPFSILFIIYVIIQYLSTFKRLRIEEKKRRREFKI